MLIMGRRLNVERIVSMGHARPEGFWYDDSHAGFISDFRSFRRLTVQASSNSRKHGRYCA
jgi:cupin 2 domain-containing protein